MITNVQIAECPQTKKRNVASIVVKGLLFLIILILTLVSAYSSTWQSRLNDSFSFSETTGARSTNSTNLTIGTTSFASALTFKSDVPQYTNSMLFNGVIYSDTSSGMFFRDSYTIAMRMELANGGTGFNSFAFTCVEGASTTYIKLSYDEPTRYVHWYDKTGAGETVPNPAVAINNSMNWITIVKDLATTSYKIYIDNTEIYSSAANFRTGNIAATKCVIGSQESGARPFKGNMSEIVVWASYALNSTDLATFFAEYSSAPVTPPSPTTPTLFFYGHDFYNQTPLTNYTIIISNSTTSFYNSTSSSLVSFYDLTLNGLYNISMYQQGLNYFNETVSLTINGTAQADASNNTYLNITGYTYQHINSVSYSGNITYWVRQLNYSVSLACTTGQNTKLNLFINNTLTELTPTCINKTLITYTGTYSPSLEANFTTYFVLNSTLGNPLNKSSSSTLFTADLYNPTITYFNLSVTAGFTNGTTNLSMTCSDTTYSPIENKLVYNSNTVYLQNVTTDQNIYTAATSQEGTNTLVGTCRDLFGSVSNSTSKQIYFRSLALIDERNNVPFDVSNVTSARVYYDDNSSYYDFKAANSSQVNFTSTDVIKLRFEIGYSSGAIVTRYVDITLEEGTLRVCANPTDVTHYEQLLVAATQRPVTVRNVFSQCLIAQDYTRFAFQDAFSLRMFTISMPYYMYLVDGTTQNFLAAIDGGLQQSYINLDTLEFSQDSYSFNILGAVISFEAAGNDSVLIYYNNQRSNIESLTATITRTDNNSVLFTTSTFTNPNEWNLLFNYSAIPNINETIQFKIALSGTKSDGTDLDDSYYFNINGSSGKLKPQFAFFIGWLLLLFGLSFAAVNLTFSWFGVIILLMAEIFFSLSVRTWYITFGQGITAILLVYIIIALVTKNQGEVI